MRALFEDLPINSGAAAFAGITLHEVGQPTARSNMRDLWFRFARVDAATAQVRAYKTREDIGTQTLYIASANITIGAGVQEITLTRNGTKTPDLTGLKIRVTATAVPANTTLFYYWAYTASPDLVTCDNLTDILTEYTGAGQSLEGFGTGAIFTGDETEAEALPVISVLSQPASADLSTDGGSLFAMSVPIEVHVVTSSLDKPNAAWRACRTLHSAVESILADERRRSFGELHTLYRTGGDGPGPAQGKPGVFVGIVKLTAKYHAVWRDDVYPRS